MPVKERKDFKTEELTYNEYYCDKCDSLIGKDIEESKHRVNFAGYDQQIWCDGCIESEIGSKNMLMSQGIKAIDKFKPLSTPHFAIFSYTVVTIIVIIAMIPFMPIGDAILGSMTLIAILYFIVGFCIFVFHMSIEYIT